MENTIKPVSELYIISFTVYEWHNKQESTHEYQYYNLEVAKKEFETLCNKSYIVKAEMYEAYPEKGKYQIYKKLLSYPPENEDES